MKTSLRVAFDWDDDETGKADAEMKSLTGMSKEVVLSSPSARAKIRALFPIRLTLSRYCIEDCE